jgi:uncharacterized protein
LASGGGVEAAAAIAFGRLSRGSTMSTDGTIPRREFLKAAPIAAAAFVHVARGITPPAQTSPAAPPAPVPPAADAQHRRIQAFDFQGVRLRESRWTRKVAATREFYLGLSNDDVLHGYRLEAGLPAPGNPLYDGWCVKDCQEVFGQWLSGMARLYRATGDVAYRDKASYLMTEWGKTVAAGDFRLRHYSYDKLMCGLVDMQLYAGHPDAVPLAEKMTDWAVRTFNRENKPVILGQAGGAQGNPSEWYTLAENLYRAYQLTGNPKFKEFAEVWLYHSYWNKFADTSAPPDAHGVHAYSHVNTFSSAAMTYGVTGDPVYLRIIRNAYDYLQRTQCYATGGYGPNEHLVRPDGSLGKALESRSDTFETGCGSWAGYKLSRYLMEFTGEARYGDWAERLVYNGAGAALVPSGNGKNFYYSDYRVAGGMKVYNVDTFTCCSGTFIQDMADFYNQIYYKDATSLYVNLYLPSEVTWGRPEGDVTLVQETGYPETETSVLTVQAKRSTAFTLKLRVPAWADGMTVSVNGAPAGVACPPGDWAVIARTWGAGDRVDVRIPLRFRMVPVDAEHPDRVAIVRGPVVMAVGMDYQDPNFRLPDNADDLNTWLIACDGPPPPSIYGPHFDCTPATFHIQPPDGKRPVQQFRPFYDMPQDYPYLVYVDLKAWPQAFW